MACLATEKIYEEKRNGMKDENNKKKYLCQSHPVHGNNADSFYHDKNSVCAVAVVHNALEWNGAVVYRGK